MLWSFCNIYIYQIIMLYTLNIYSVICQLHLNKTGGAGGQERPPLCPQDSLDTPSCVCLQATPGWARKVGRRRAPLSRPCPLCSGFVFWQLPHSVVFLPSATAFAKVDVLLLVCVSGKFKQIDGQFKEHSSSLCAMSDSQWDQDSWWVRIHQNRTLWNVCKILWVWVWVHTWVCTCVCVHVHVCFPEDRMIAFITSQSMK